MLHFVENLRLFVLLLNLLVLSVPDCMCAACLRDVYVQTLCCFVFKGEGVFCFRFPAFINIKHLKTFPKNSGIVSVNCIIIQYYVKQ